MLAGAKVRLYLGRDSAYGETLFYGPPAEMLPTAHTGADGRFVLGGFPLGAEISVLAEHVGFEQDYAWRLTTQADVRDAGKITLKPGIAVAGTVRYDDGKPAAGAVVRIGYFNTPTTTTADEKGAYEFKGLPQMFFYNPFVPLAAHVGEPADWEGGTRYEGRLQPGDRAGGVDLVLKRSMRWKRNEWTKTTGPTTVPGAESKYLAAVVDDVDDGTAGKFNDVVSVIDGQGRTRWQHAGVNVSISIQRHSVAQQPADHSLWLIAHGLTKLKPDGSVDFENKHVKASALAIDPKSGNVWVLTNAGTLGGDKLLIFNPAGVQVNELKIGGFDLVYSRHDDCFWVAGNSLRKVDRDGKILVESQERFAWLVSGIDVNESDGSVWMLEHGNPQEAGSRDRAIIFEPDGRVRKSIDLMATGVAVDAMHGNVWISGTADGLALFTPAGELVKHVPTISAGIVVEPDTGCVWAAGRDGIWRIDPKGSYLWGKGAVGEGTERVGDGGGGLKIAGLDSGGIIAEIAGESGAARSSAPAWVAA